jgi:isopentenyldiphosphate isomerase
MEMVDVIDSNGKRLQAVSKDKAHQEGLLHTCVIGLLFNSKKEMMLIKPPKNKQDEGQYVCPVGGHVTSGESEIEALKREVEEEIGITQFDQKRIGQVIFNRHILGRHENHLFVLFEIFSDQEPSEGDELESMHWFSEEKFKAEIKKNRKEFGDSFYFLLERFYPQLLQ